MNILLVTEFFPDLKKQVFTGGVEARCYYLAKHLSKDNKITVLSRLLADQKKIEQSGNITIKRLGIRQNSSTASINSLFSRFLFQFQAFFSGVKIQADIVEGSNFISYLPAFSIAKKLNVPCLAWYPDVFIGKWVTLFGPLLGFFGETIERLVLKLPWNGIIAISQSTKEKLIKKGFKRKITVIPCGVDINEFSTNTKFENPTIIAICRLEKYKRLDLLINAVLITKKDIKNINLIIVGAGPEEENLKKLMPSAIFKKNLPRNELINLLEKSHILCHPSTEEGFGIVLIESLAANTPYIASNIPAIKEITYDGTGGILFERNDVKALTEAILFLLKDKKLYNIKQKEGKTLIQKYTWKNISKETYEYYCSVANI